MEVMQKSKQPSSYVEFKVDNVNYGNMSRHCGYESPDFYKSMGRRLFKLNWDDERKAVVEASSLENSKLSKWSFEGASFINCAVLAFAKHLPIALNPDQIWSLIMNGFSRHVQENSEKLRKHFVNFEKKKKLIVKVSMTPGTTKQKDWEDVLFKGFMKQLHSNLKGNVFETVTTPFSTTTSTDKLSNAISLMSMVSPFFMYEMQTMCGIPNIRLYGNPTDWQNLRKRTEQLGAYMTPKFRDLWLSSLLPVLDEFVKASEGKEDVKFWSGFVKHVKGYSGEMPRINGWIKLFYPYLKGGLNPHLNPWTGEITTKGPQVADFPSTISSAPIKWDHMVGKTYELEFFSGLMGFTTTPDRKCLTPLNGWLVVHKPA